MNHKIHAVNSGYKPRGKRWLLGMGGFSTCGLIYLLIWADALDDALDEAVDWCVDNAPGLVADDAYNEAYNEALADIVDACDEETLDQDEAAEQAADEAAIDMTCAGNYGTWIHSEDWHLIAEDPSRALLLELQGRTDERRARRAA